jgi:hypothetical protein
MKFTEMELAGDIFDRGSTKARIDHFQVNVRQPVFNHRRARAAGAEDADYCVYAFCVVSMPQELGFDCSEAMDQFLVMAAATATSVASVPGPPRIDRPTGKPPTSVPGMLTCGTPVSPP